MLKLGFDRQQFAAPCQQHVIEEELEERASMLIVDGRPEPGDKGVAMAFRIS